MSDLKNKQLEAIKKIENFPDNDADGLFGFCIMGGQDEAYSYRDVGCSTLEMFKEYPEQAELLEKMLIAISGYGLESLLKKMKVEQDYYDSL